MEKIALIAGKGRLPLLFMQKSKEENIDLYPIGLFEEVDDEIKTHPKYREFHIGHLKKFIEFFHENGIKKVAMLGKVEKNLIFDNLDLDYVGGELLKKLPDNKDETLLFGIIIILRMQGIKVLPQNSLLKSIMTKKKVYTDVKPSKEDEKTIKMGKEAAKMLSGIDAGQTVICKDNSVVALEGIEGTDKTIERAGEYAGKDCIIVKMSRPQQDMKVDIPTVGISTVKKAISIGAKGLVVEAGRMLFVDSEESIKLANENNMFIIGI